MNEKGITKVVSTILLMSIAVAAVSSAAIFIGGTFYGIQQGVESWIEEDDRRESSSISINYGYNGTNGSLIVELRNNGGRALVIENEQGKRFNMYFNGIPESWKYVSEDLKTTERVTLNTGSDLLVNTTRDFPEEGKSSEVEFTGPYSVEASFACFSREGKCQN
jgi:hypothetical protein